MDHSDNELLDKSLLDPKLWIRDFTWTRDGFCYTLNSSLKVGTHYEDSAIAIFANNDDTHQIIYIHDPDFFVINDNPTALSKTRRKVMTNTYEYQRISLVRHILLDQARSPCEMRKDYSFRSCVRNSLAEKVGCRLPWPALESYVDLMPICQNLSQFLQFESLYAQIEEMSTRSIENLTKCWRPCQYKEYRMVGGPAVMSDNFEGHRITSAFLFWFVSTETLVEEQSFVYPWQSLVVFSIISKP